MSAKKILIGIILLAVALPAIEGLTSFGLLANDIADLQAPPPNFRQATYDSLVGWIGLSNLKSRDNFGPNITLTTDAAGLRIHRPTPPIPAPGETRIMCSGASFTFGSGVSDTETYCALFEQLMPGVRTVNVAQRGYGIDQSYLWYEREHSRYPHQLQILAVNGTDFERTAESMLNGYPKPQLIVKDGALVAQNVPVPQWKGWSRWTDAGPQIAKLRILQMLAGRSEMSEADRYRRVDDKLWPMVEAVFRDLNKSNLDQHGAFVVVYLPTEDEYLPGARDERRTRLAKSTTAAGIPFVDLTSDLRQIPRDSLDWLFITTNTIPVSGISGHYTALGHRWLAQRLLARFRALPTLEAALTSHPG